MNSVLIYITELSPRANYTFEVLLKGLLGISFETTTNISAFNNYSGAKFSYGVKSIATELHFEAIPLLFEKNIDNKFYQNKTIDEAFAINDKAHFGIDIFAASFFLLSRYEEYNQPNFNYAQSILHRSKLLQHPVVNEWTMELKKVLQLHFLNLQFIENKFKITPTIDVDRAFAFKARNIFTTIGGLIKDVLKFNFAELIVRLKVLANKKADPFDVFEKIETIHQSAGLQTIYFVHCGSYNGVDKNINLNHPLFKTAIQKIAKRSWVGIHPSIKSITETDLLPKEIAFLQSILPEQKITKSRQHFIELIFPNSYQSLLKNGISADYTMGYADETGFRAGICNSYCWYDIENEKQTALIIHPFCLMEATYQYFKNNDAKAFLADAEIISNTIKNVNGELCFVWHNQSFSEIYEYKGWSKIYNDFLTVII
ncbi:MAG: hypothetical protein RL708_2077 [Bacteroidota bacterium]|jgi:hypothetical protein